MLCCIAFYKVNAQVDSTKARADSLPRIAPSTTVSATDSTTLAKKNKKKIYSIARRASIMSAILPGLGQAYNKKYWKLPIIYAGLGGFGYLFATNNKEYKYYRKNLKAWYDSDSSTVNVTRYTGAQLQVLKADFKKSRNFGLIGMAAIYLVNIIDANVDGHLRTFDVSDDLSLSVDPWQSIYRRDGFKSAMGLSIKLNFK